MTNRKYAILDTDFISKANIIQNEAGDVLANRVLTFPGYVFVCHEMMLQELSRHGTRPAQEWMREQIETGTIRKYTDETILDMLAKELGKQCYLSFMTFLKQSCDAFAANYFEEKYSRLISLFHGDFTKQEFLAVLAACDASIGPQQSLGEKKAYVLLLALQFLKGDDVYIFCSDDFGARKGLSDSMGIPCISIIAVFFKLKNMGVSKEEAATYFRSYCAFCNRSNQTTLRVWEFHGAYRRQKMALADVFDGLYDGKFSLMLNGDLLIKND